MPLIPITASFWLDGFFTAVGLCCLAFLIYKAIKEKKEKNTKTERRKNKKTQ